MLLFETSYNLFGMMEVNRESHTPAVNLDLNVPFGKTLPLPRCQERVYKLSFTAKETGVFTALNWPGSRGEITAIQS